MQNQLDNKVYAGFFVRLVAFAIDSLIAGLIVGIVKLPFSIAASGGVTFLKANFIFDYSFIDVLGYVGVAAYFVLLTYFSHSTLGKKLLRLEVVTTTGEWTFLNVLYRETVGRFLSSILCIGYLAVIVTPEKRGFHDMLCDTNVVYAKMMPESGKKMEMEALSENDILEDSVLDNTEINVAEKPQGEVKVPVYYTVSSFQKEENQSPSTDIQNEQLNPGCSNLQHLMENREEEL